MSRFVQCLKKLDVVNLAALEEVLDDLKESLEADSAYMELTFPYFIEKKAPVSGFTSPLDLDCTFIMEKGRPSASG